MKTRVVRYTVIDREECFQLYTRKEFSIEETTELRSERQIKCHSKSTFSNQGKEVRKGQKFLPYHKRKREMSLKKEGQILLNISRSSNISIVQGCSIQCLRDLLNSTFCVSASILRCWQERCQSSRFHTDSQQRHFLLILFYFKSSKILPRNLYQAFPVCH